jgi:hypothetical protein
MEAFSPTPPDWTKEATHAYEFCCPNCHSSSTDAIAVWINRRSPVMLDYRRRKWQEFYHCQCGKVWWAWSSDRPPNEFADRVPNNDDDNIDLDNYFGYF